MAKYDDWDLRIAREAVEYNRANPDPEHAGAEQWAEERLAMIEAYFSEGKGGTATPVADEAEGTLPRGNGSTNYGRQATTGATPKQESFIRSLCDERGVDADALLATIKTSRQASEAIDRLKAQPRQQQVRPATERQMEFLQDLLAEREHKFTDVANLNFDAASAMITALLEAPRVSKAPHGIRQGRYAFQPEGAPAQFYRVSQRGYIYVQAGPAEHPYRGQLNEALQAIKADPKAAAELYGQLIGACGRCGLPLTDETSRSLGLGPVCASKSDW